MYNEFGEIVDGNSWPILESKQNVTIKNDSIKK